MRLIDADKLKKKIRHWNYNATTSTPTFSFVTEEDIDNMQTVDVLDKIRADIEKVFCMSVVTNELRTPMEVKDEILQIIDSYNSESEEQ